MKTKRERISIFWFRRDLRISDNKGLHNALKGASDILPIFIFDTNIIGELPIDDARVTFIYDLLQTINAKLNKHGSSVYCKKGDPYSVWKNLTNEFDIEAVYANEDYEPYAIKRDEKIKEFLLEQGIPFFLFKDHVIFAKNEVLKNDGTPYTVYTPYKNKWLQHLSEISISKYTVSEWNKYVKKQFKFPDLTELNFVRSSVKVHNYKLNDLDNYKESRDFPSLNGTSKLGAHLRFGTVSIRDVVLKMKSNQVFLNELVWREFFMQILYHFPHVVANNFKPKYDNISWRNNPEEYERWTKGETGYPMVDAGIHELISTGYMHNRVRMVVAGFLCKHLLIASTINDDTFLRVKLFIGSSQTLATRASVPDVNTPRPTNQ